MELCHILHVLFFLVKLYLISSIGKFIIENIISNVNIYITVYGIIYHMYLYNSCFYYVKTSNDQFTGLHVYSKNPLTITACQA